MAEPIGEAMCRARDWLAEASRVVVLTGAGISAESGVPTFRGEDGLWRNFRPEELASPEAFQHDPQLVWEWYDWRRGLIAETQPNAGHFALAELEERVREFTLVTQNVDGLHDLAGSRHILKLHGDIWHLRCMECGRVVEDRQAPLAELPPHCACGGMQRPDVIWFGEALSLEILNAAWGAAANAELFLLVGTSALVQPAASLPTLAKERGAKLVEINLAPTILTPYADAALCGKAAELLPQLLA